MCLYWASELRILPKFPALNILALNISFWTKIHLVEIDNNVFWITPYLWGPAAGFYNCGSCPECEVNIMGHRHSANISLPDDTHVRTSRSRAIASYIFVVLSIPLEDVSCFRPCKQVVIMPDKKVATVRWLLT